MNDKSQMYLTKWVLTGCHWHYQINFISHIIVFYFVVKLHIFASNLIECCSVAKLCPTLCHLVDCSTPGFPVFHYLPESTQTHVHWVGDATQPSHPLPHSFLLAFSLSQNQGLFQWVSSSHQVAKVLEFQLQHQSFQWIFRTDFPLGWTGWKELVPKNYFTKKYK